ncbi:MAG: hypothetical protein JSY10_28525 [Paenibacillus sp.]|nr:hypothetical protein [Paenibacillus sp.]
MSICLIVNEKSRQNVSPWGKLRCFIFIFLKLDTNKLYRRVRYRCRKVFVIL